MDCKNNKGRVLRVLGLREAVFDTLFAVLDRAVFRRKLRKGESPGTVRMESSFSGFSEPHVGHDLCESDTGDTLADPHDLD